MLLMHLWTIRFRRILCYFPVEKIYHGPEKLAFLIEAFAFAA
jgi:hypothetical protein